MIGENSNPAETAKLEASRLPVSAYNLDSDPQIVTRFTGLSQDVKLHRQHPHPLWEARQG